MGRNTTTYCLVLVTVMLLPLVGQAQEPQVPAAQPAAPQAAPTPPSPQSNAGTTGTSPGAAWNSEVLPSVPPPAAALPLAYSASRSESALRVEDLMRGASALRQQGNFAKAMALYNDALAIAPLYPEAYRQRALTLVRLGDRVQAQIDYNRYLALDRDAPRHVREELVLFQQSAWGQPGQAEAAAYRYGPMIPLGPSGESLTSEQKIQQFAQTRFSLARDAFQRGDYDAALLWATNSNADMPEARTRALMAQILLAQADYRGAAAEARAAIAMEPVMDWRTLYNYYGYATPRLSGQIHALEEFVRQNPSSADGHFMLGYERMILGQRLPAHAELAIAAVLEPTDVAATALLAKEGVEIVKARRPQTEAVGQEATTPPQAGVEVARRPTPPIGVGPWSAAGGVSHSEGTTQREILR